MNLETLGTTLVDKEHLYHPDHGLIALLQRMSVQLQHLEANVPTGSSEVSQLQGHVVADLERLKKELFGHGRTK